MGPLKGIRICDLTRVLAGPTCTQILGDLGADVIKVEQPNVGDITRTWGPPFEKDASGNDTTESAYYLSCNRNKRSIALDFTQEAGRETLLELIKTSDVFVENFKTGTLKKYGLSYEDVKALKPDIIYCSITGFGQTGPFADQPGYDFQAQGLSGMMSLNGEKEGPPLRAGISLADISTGVYSALSILAALFHRERTGQGQQIDMALLDTQTAMLSFAAQSYLLDGKQPLRVGNGHPNIVPYGAFQASDGYVVLAIGTDTQFQKFCQFVGRETWAQDPRFITNDQRVAHRDILVGLVQEIIRTQPQAHWISHMESLGIPSGPVNTLDQAFGHPQSLARHLSVPLGHLQVVASPVRLSETPVSYTRRPPHLGEHTEEVLEELKKTARTSTRSSTS